MSKGTRKYLKKKLFWFIITLVAAVLLNFFLPRLMRGAGVAMLRDPLIRNPALADEEYVTALAEQEAAAEALKAADESLSEANKARQAEDTPMTKALYSAAQEARNEAKEVKDKADAKEAETLKKMYKKYSDALAARTSGVWEKVDKQIKPLAYEKDDSVIETKLKEFAGGDAWLEQALLTIPANNGRNNARSTYERAVTNAETKTAEYEALNNQADVNPDDLEKARLAMVEAQENVETSYANIQKAWEADCDRFKERFGTYHERSDISIQNLVKDRVNAQVWDDAAYTRWINTYDEIEKDLGRDGGMLGELWQFIRHIFDGTFGKSTSSNRYPKTVSSIIGEGIIWTLSLQIPAILVGWILGNVLGAVAAYRRKMWDKAVMPASLFVSAIPAFGSAVILLVIFGITLKWFPANRAYDPGMIPAFSWNFIGNVLWHYQLPFWSIVLIAIGGQAVGMRSMSIYELNADYVKYSRFLGIKDGRIVRYVFRNAMLPQVTGLAMSIGSSIGGALVAETIFSYPGLGMKMYSAISENDYNTVSGIALIITIMVLIAAFLLDLIYAVIDPRVKAAQFD